MLFYGYHGALEEEQKIGSRFEVDLDLRVDLARPSLTDLLSQTVDYKKVYHMIREVVEESRFHLLEKLAAAIAEKVLEGFDVDEVTVRLRKPHAAIEGVLDSVEVELTRKKGGGS